MRFGQFDRVTISMNDPHVHINGDVAWVVGIEKVELLRKDGKTIGFDAFVTNVLEKKDSRLADGRASGDTGVQAARMAIID
jgi:ketosteroid isomerase-like protein